MTALTADTSATATAMATEILGSGFTIDSATYTGDDASSGIFTDGDTTNPDVLPSDTGVILSTGNVSDFANAGGGNTSGGTSTDTNDAGGTTPFGAGTFDASFLTITFTPEPGQTSLNLEFRFYSEEYNEYVYSNFNDVALVQLDGVTQPISVGSGEISVNGINNAGVINPTQGDQLNDPNPGNGVYDSANPNLYIDNTGGAYDTEMDGFTVTLSLDIPVTPGVQQTLMIGIADTGDAAFDSSLVIASNNVPETTDTDPIAMDDTGIETFGANPRTVDILSNDSDPNGQALTITQINGVDVVAGQTVSLPTGQDVTLNANGTITLVNSGGALGETSFSYTVSDTDGNTDSAFVSFDAAPICFCQGTRIETVHGPRPVEDLAPGDFVLTRDAGPQPVRWIGQRRMMADAAAAPVELRPGVLGNARALVVSPQHRILFAGHKAQLYFSTSEVLVSAQQLLRLDGVVRRPPGPVSYFHILFDNHQIVMADGVPCESYHPGHYSLSGLSRAGQAEVFELFPSLRSDPGGYGPAARMLTKNAEAALLVA